jgi:hypothetical protein
MAVTVTVESLLSPSPSGAPVPPGVKAATSKPPAGLPRCLVSMFALAAVVVALVVIVNVFKDATFLPRPTKLPIDGMTIFAVFFVSASAIERLLEPLSSWLLPKQKKKSDAESADGNAKSAVTAAQNSAAGQTEVETANSAIQTAADNAADLEEREWHRSILFWVIATIVAMLASASFKLYLLGTVGIAEASRWEEVLATGLIIGAGTKPLHDLTELISAKKAAAAS